ncbi:MAG: methyl-accepting chemotaxis protein, partial [Syntrophobacteraceae bacterium]|nr:methyl-accepting chemotaxis protein [Syntrophobacteraceae bacterium]
MSSNLKIGTRIAGTITIVSALFLCAVWAAGQRSGGAAGSSTTTVMVGAIVFGVIVSFSLGFFLIRHINAAFRSLLEEAKGLADSVAAGKLDIRCDPEKVNFELRGVANNLNRVLDEVSAPLDKIGSCVAGIGKGEIPEKILCEWQGDFKEIKDNLNKCVEQLGGLEECNAVLQRMDVNDHTRKVEGRYSGLFGSTSAAINELRERLLTITKLFTQVSLGDTSSLSGLVEMGKRSPEDLVQPACVKCMGNIGHLVDDVAVLSKAALDGDLAKRADAGSHNGGYAQIVEGFNQILDAVVGPLQAAANCVDQIGRGEVPPKITEEYKGDFLLLKNNVNHCIDGLGGLVECNAVLSRMAVNDHTKKVEGKYTGLFASVSEGANLVRDRLLAITGMFQHFALGDTSDLAVYEKIGRRSDEDIIVPSAIKCMQNINALIEDMRLLSQAAVAGNLAKRADVEKHHGGYRQIAEGVNETLDAVVGPLRVAAGYVAQISRGEVPPKITEEYKGDFNEIKNNLNLLIDAMVEITNTAEQIAAGNLTVKVVERSHQDRLMQEMSKMVEGLTAIVTTIQGVADQVAIGSKELSSSAELLSQGSTEQSSSVEEISSSMEQMAANIKQNSDNSHQTEKIAVKAAEDGREGGEAVAQTVAAMKEIAGKISIIEEIARQTNLLALNAAIEAAR